MKRLPAVALLLLALRAAVAGEPAFAVYRWAAANTNGGAAAVEAYAKWIGRPDLWAEDFPPTESWDHLHGQKWQLGEWSAWKKGGAGRRLIFGVPMLPGPWDLSGPKGGADANKPVSLAAGARGDYNQHFKALAGNLVEFDLADSILRIGWEWNGGWYAWRARENPKAYAAFWREIVTTMRAVPGAERLQFCWNPALGWIGHPVEDAWPGDAFVDYVGLDVYDQSYAQNTYPWPTNATPDEIAARQRKVWNDVVYGGDKGIVFWCDFAKRHGKPFCIPEWGVHAPSDGHGGGDNPYFIEQMHRFIHDPSNNVAFHCYFDVQAGDGHHQLSPGLRGAEPNQFPRSTARFQELFGRR